MNQWLDSLATQISSMQLLFTLVSAFVHVLFAAGVAKDAGILQQRGRPTYLVSGITWAFATLVGGALVAAIYWLLHHSKITSH